METLQRRSPADRVGGVFTAMADRLPPRLRRVVTPELIGFSILGTATFAIDMALLAALRTWTPLPLWADVTIAYLVAFGLSFVLNRTVNFRSKAPVAGESLRYTVVAGADYVLTLGVTTGFSSLGLDYRIARVMAACCVALLTFAASRFWVFRR